MRSVIAASTPGTLADVSVDPALAELYEAKAQTYAAFGNGAIAAHAQRLLPDGGRVLDIGCAAGGLLAHLRWFTRDALAALLGGAGLRNVELHAVVPALRNHAPATVGRLLNRLEPAWQAAGRRAPGLL